MRVVSLACSTPTGPLLHLYQILSYYLKQYGSYGAQDFSFRGDNYIRKKVRVVSLAWYMHVRHKFSICPMLKILPRVFCINMLLIINQILSKCIFVFVMLYLFVLRFYGPVNPMGSCRVRSVYLTTFTGQA